MMTKDEVIEAYVLHDGKDDARYEEAIRASAPTDRPVSVCFKSLVNLETKGLISLTEENNG